jgi:phosphatidylethanolamine/phosphatidyl-N-methylethanolamine N-methyltransferase
MKTLVHDLSIEKVTKAYSYWAWVYDALCGPLFRPAHVAITQAANKIGGHVLEVGVGTGLLLPRYRKGVSVTGLDLSEKMLTKARARLGEGVLSQVVALEAGDIHELQHPDCCYDVIVMPFVLTLLSNPEKALDNCYRMVKGGGEIIIVSHFQSQTGWIASTERWLAPRVASMGLRPDFQIKRVKEWANRRHDVTFLTPEPVGMLGVYTLLRMRKIMASTEPNN